MHHSGKHDKSGFLKYQKNIKKYFLQIRTHLNKTKNKNS
jgi:hypothetical protein